MVAGTEHAVCYTRLSGRSPALGASGAVAATSITQCKHSATGFHHLRYVIRLIEEYASCNAAGSVSGGLASVENGEVGTRRAVSLRNVPSAQVAGKLDFSEEEVDLLTRLKKRKGAFGSARFNNLPPCIPKLACQDIAHRPFIIDE
jgi:hypothetical protein